MTFGHIETVMTFIVANVTRPSVAFQASGPPALPPTVDRWVTGLQYISRRSVTDEGSPRQARFHWYNGKYFDYSIWPNP
jgi:hypothetical protein